MASLNVDKSGNRRIQFRAPDGKRKTIYLGKLPKRQAQTVKGYVERLIVAAVSGDSIDADTAAWLMRITDELHGKLAAVGLIPARQKAALGHFWRGIASKDPTLSRQRKWCGGTPAAT